MSRHDTDIVPAIDFDSTCVAVSIDRLLRLTDTCYRLESYAEIYVFAVRYAALYAAASVGGSTNTVAIGNEYIVVFRASQNIL